MPRARRILKWAGLAACLLIVAAWVLSVVGGVVWSVGGIDVGLVRGAFAFDSMSPGGELKWFGVSPTARVFWLPDGVRVPGRGRVEYVPLWIPLLIAATSTFIAWRRDRKLPPGHCRCGYNLTGNVSGRCPECGAEVEAGP